MNFSRAVAAEKMYPTPWMETFDAYSLVKATRETLWFEGFIVTVCSFSKWSLWLMLLVKLLN